MQHDELFNLIKRIKSISDIGLLYCNNEYDKERYSDLLQISYELLHKITGKEITLLKNLYLQNTDYPTAKVDVRGLLIKDNKILLVKESTDNKWALPGGWADIGFSPKEVIVKEYKEETGLEVITERLLAVFDKKFHPHPPQPFYVYKMVFYCRAISTTLTKGFDITDVNYFDVENLPELSEDRILKSQVELVFQKASMPGTDTYFD
ncbi:MAG: NUDIX hydrolase [Ferruginibacter sp.]|nr:NUDIX hydrolase [Ferruginibacter sp.]